MSVLLILLEGRDETGDGEDVGDGEGVGDCDGLKTGLTAQLR